MEIDESHEQIVHLLRSIQESIRRVAQRLEEIDDKLDNIEHEVRG